MNEELPRMSNEKYFQELSYHLGTNYVFTRDVLDVLNDVKQYGRESRAFFYLFMSAYRNRKLFDGLSEMLRTRNLLCAASMVRMQIDNCMRLNAPLLVARESAEKVLLTCLDKHGKLQKLKVRVNGEEEKLSDFFLKNELEKRMKGTQSIYDELSGYIHLDAPSFWSSYVSHSGTLQNFSIGSEASEIFNPKLLELAEIFGIYTITQKKIMMDYKDILPLSELELAKATSSLRGESGANDEAISQENGDSNE